MRSEIASFRQGEDDSLFDAWEIIKELLSKFLHNGIRIYIQLETFYNGSVPSLRNMWDAYFCGTLLFKSYNRCPKEASWCA